MAESIFTLASGWQNLLEYSEEFSNWATAGVSVSDNATRGPDGNILADEIIENSANSQHFTNKTANSITSGATHTFSVYAKPNARNKIRMQFGSGGPTAVYTLTGEGSVSNESLGGTGIITKVSNDFYKCSVTGDSDATSEICYILILNDSGQSTYLGDGVSSVYLWGSQLVERSGLSPYVKTTDATVDISVPDSFITVSPEYDYKTSGKKIEDVHRTKSGSQYRYNWGDFDSVEFSLRYVNLHRYGVLNNWWGENKDLLFSNWFTGDSWLVHITNRTKPIDKVEKPYIDLYKGKLILETYE